MCCWVQLLFHASWERIFCVITWFSIDLFDANVWFKCKKTDLKNIDWESSVQTHLQQRHSYSPLCNILFDSVIAQISISFFIYFTNNWICSSLCPNNNILFSIWIRYNYCLNFCIGRWPQKSKEPILCQLISQVLLRVIARWSVQSNEDISFTNILLLLFD